MIFSRPCSPFTTPTRGVPWSCSRAVYRRSHGRLTSPPAVGQAAGKKSGSVLPQKSADASALLAQKGPRRITIRKLRNVDADSFSGAVNDGLRADHTKAQVAALKSRIDALNANLKAVGEARKGDVIHF